MMRTDEHCAALVICRLQQSWRSRDFVVFSHISTLQAITMGSLNIGRTPQSDNLVFLHHLSTKLPQTLYMHSIE